MTEDLVVFELAQQRYGLSVGQVREVLPRATLTPLVGAPAGLLGVLSLRGDLLPVLDLRLRLGLPPVQPSIGQCIVVTEMAPAAVGLLVDGVVGIVAGDWLAGAQSVGAEPSSVESDASVLARRVTPEELPDGRPGEVVRRVTRLQDQVVSILDPDPAVGPAIRAYLAAVLPLSDAPARAALTPAAASIGSRGPDG